MKTEKLLILPDAHIPFHDERALALVAQVAKAWRPDHTIILGDFLDLYTLSRHQKDPELRHWNLREEIAAGRTVLKNLRAQTDKMTYLSGNHEKRFDKYIAERAPDMAGINTIPELLGLDALKIDWVPYQDIFTLGKINYVHDTGAHGGNAYLQAEYDIAGSAVIGHVHRMNYAILGNARGNAHVAASFGWLGDARYAKYMPAASRRRYWSLGIGTGRMLADGVTYLQPRPFIKYTVEIDGVIYRG